MRNVILVAVGTFFALGGFSYWMLGRLIKAVEATDIDFDIYIELEDGEFD